jgi:hypothetical protein
MSYTITTRDGQLLGTILDGTVNTINTDLVLVGRNYSNYGQLMVDNLVRLLESFSNAAAPTSPLVGQLWWDSNEKRLKIWANSTVDTSPGAGNWRNVGSATVATAAPNTTVAGDLWLNSSTSQFYVYDGTTPFNANGWILVGPGYNVNNGKSTAIWEQITDTASISHNVVSIYLDGVRTAIISKDSEFQPLSSISGYGNIQTGYNMNSSYTIYGTANNASFLGNQPAANYFRNNINNSGTGTLNIVNDGGLTIGSGNDLTLSVNNIHSRIINNTNGGNVEIYANVSGVSTKYVSINGTNGTVEVAAAPTTTLGIATKGYVDNRFIDANLWGVSTAVTAPVDTANTWVATTEFVINNSGFLKNKIYQGNSYMEILDTGVGSANLVVDGISVMTASASGVNLRSGALAVTQPDTYNGSGNSRVATTQFVKNATQWWGGSAKFVSSAAPQAGVNDMGSNNGDFWFQYTI